MIRVLIWSVLAGGLGLAYLTIESASGMHDSYTTYATSVLWLVLAPICAIGAMIHNRASSEHAVRYSKSLKIGLMTSSAAAVVLLGVWLLYINVLDPQYLSIPMLVADAEATALGYNEIQRAQKINAAVMIFSQPGFSIVCLLLPTVSGAIASALAAIGIRKR